MLPPECKFLAKPVACANFPLPGGPKRFRLNIMFAEQATVSRIPESPTATNDYRRRARRLRRLHAGDPQRLQPALYQLSRQADVAAAPSPEVITPTPHVLFAQSVAARLDGPILRYSERQSLLKEAERRGLGRFEANLVIALVEHRRGGRLPRPMAPRRLPNWLLGAGLVVLIQSLILGLAYVAFG